PRGSSAHGYRPAQATGGTLAPPRAPPRPVRQVVTGRGAGDGRLSRQPGLEKVVPLDYPGQRGTEQDAPDSIETPGRQQRIAQQRVAEFGQDGKREPDVIVEDDDG